MTFNLRLRQLQQKLHDHLCSDILDTPAVVTRPSAVSICSLVSRRDFLMYLVAIKTFYANFGEGRVYVVDDGTLSMAQKSLLRDQIQGVTVVSIREVPRRRVPVGGCWERLLFMVELARTSYVIQLDADTLTRQPIAEVGDACRNERPFIIAGDREGGRIVLREEASRFAQKSPGQHIQSVFEKQLAEIDGLKPFYVRGCAAFFGLPAGSLSLEEVEEWSDVMTGKLGERWSEWGTEQATVNYFLANLPGASVLHPPKYTHRWRTPPGEDSAFIHFIGTHRFERQFYARQSRKAIKALQCPVFRPGALGVLT